MVSVKVLLKENQPKKDGTIPILFRITSGRKSKYISTGEAVKKNQFREGVENWVYHHPDAPMINAKLEKKRSDIMAAVYQAEMAGETLVVEAIGKKNYTGQTFIKLLLAQQTVFEQRNQVSAFDKLSSRIKNLRAAWEQDVPAAQINKHWVDKFIADRYKKNASPNTIKKDLSIFSSVLQKSDGYKGKDYFKEAQKNIRKVPVQKVKLTLAEIKLLEITPLYNLEAVARDMFLFSYYTQGMRFQSVALFKRDYIKEHYIIYQMNKGKKFREVVIHDKLRAIIDRYKGGKAPFLFPVMKEEITDVWKLDKAIDVASTTIRTRLSRAAIICGIDKHITMHIAKHTFASLSLKRGVSYEVLKDALGHSDFKTTQMYLDSLSDDQVNDAVKGLYDD